MQFVIFRIFGYIPSPIIFGNVIDSTCMYWKANCGRQGGSCLIYNIEHFRLRYIGVCSALKVAAGLLFFLDWILVCYNTSKTEEATHGKTSPSSNRKRKVCSFASRVRGVCGQQTKSVVSLDKIHHLDNSQQQPDNEIVIEGGLDSDYNSAADVEVDQEIAAAEESDLAHPNLTPNAHLESLLDFEPRRRHSVGSHNHNC